MFAVSSLGELGAARGEELTEFLSSTDPMVKWLAHQALQTIPLAQDPNVILYWVKLVTSDQESPVYRALAATTLGMLGDQRAVPPLMAQLRDDSETVRQFSALALGRLGNQAAVTPLFQALIDPDEMVRYAVGTALALLGTVVLCLLCSEHAVLGSRHSAARRPRSEQSGCRCAQQLGASCSR